MTRDNSLWLPCLEKATAVFVDLDDRLHERLAQLLVFHGMRSVKEVATAPEAKVALERIDETFGELMRRSPNDYQMDEYVEVPKHRIGQSIRLLKNQTLVGLRAWDIVVWW